MRAWVRADSRHGGVREDGGRLPERDHRRPDGDSARAGQVRAGIRFLASAASSRLLDPQEAGHVDQHDVTMGFEPSVGSQLTGADLKLQFHRRGTTIACHAALAYVGRILGEESDERERSRPCGPHTAARAAPFEIKDVRVSVVGVGARQCKSSVPPTPRFDVG